MPYRPEPPAASTPSGTAVLLVNLGTPDAPTPAAVRRYLGEFLADPGDLTSAPGVSNFHISCI